MQPTSEICSVTTASKKNGSPELCAQCALATGQPTQFCGHMGTEQDYYVLDCQSCGKTVVDRFGRCCALNCKEAHGGRWELTFSKPGVFLKIYDPVTHKSLIDKNDERS